jgi:hypothetical protein
MTPRINSRVLVQLTLLLTLAAPLVGQEAAGDDGVFRVPAGSEVFEGRPSVQVSAAGNLQLVSFLGFREDFFDADVDLRVRYWMPDDTPVFVIATEIQEEKLYKLEVEPFGWAKDRWNEWGPWPTGQWLRAENIPPWNLGLVVRLDKKDSRRVAPAYVFYSRPQPTDTYSVHLRAHEDLTGVRYSLKQGSTLVAQEVLKISPSAGEPVEIRLAAHQLQIGPATLEVVAKVRNQGEAAPMVYEFFHHPLN